MYIALYFWILPLVPVSYCFSFYILQSNYSYGSAINSTSRLMDFFKVPEQRTQHGLTKLLLSCPHLDHSGKRPNLPREAG